MLLSYSMVLLQPGDQPAQFVVGVGDFSVIGMIRDIGTGKVQADRTGCGDRTNAARRKTDAAAVFCFQSFSSHRKARVTLSPALRSTRPISFCLKRFGGESVVIEIKAASQSPTAVQNKRTDHCACDVALLFEHLRHRTEPLIEGLPGKILHAILKRIGAGQDGGVRRPCKGHLGDGSVEDNAIASQAVHDRGLNVGRAVTPEVIRAHGVNGNENYVGGWLASRWLEELKPRSRT